MYNTQSPQKPFLLKEKKEKNITGIVTYIDKLGKIKIDIFPQACTVNDLNKAINFLMELVAQKEKP